MNRSGLRDLVVTGLKSLQELSGRPWQDLRGDSRVVGALDGFDSIAGIEATSMLEQRVIELGLGTKIDADSVFMDDRHPLTLNEVVDRLAASIKGAKT